MKGSRDILTDFFALSSSMEEIPEIKQQLDAFISSLKRKDLRKSKTRIQIWNFLNALRKQASPDLRDGFEGIMADLIENWEGSLNRALDENKIREE